MGKSPEVILVHETIAESVVKDVVSFVALSATVGVGVYLDSTALQWIAGIAWILFGLSRASKIVQANTFTIERARKRLDELERQFSEA